MTKVGKILVAIGFILIIGAYLIAGYIDTHYSTTAQVYEVEDNSVLLIDGAGYIWEVIDRPDLQKGDFVKITFDNNTTSHDRTDDIIKSVKVLP